jgi:hypothetical protein
LPLEGKLAFRGAANSLAAMTRAECGAFYLDE